MIKNIFLLGSLYISSIILIATDFFNGIPWYIQFGPLLVFGSLTAVITIWNMDAEEDETLDKTAENSKYINFIPTFILVSILFLIAGMNIFVGAPRNDIFNITDFSFWIVFVALPILNRVYVKVAERQINA
ncbi:hypothetical protein AALF85_10305 [Jeotgalicoccus halotolerans]|uniref:hypothetical protein n=1 Tax=Jeotgalicoccus halotolerans TaxID=157227 RepID=UPI003519A5B9